MPPLPSFSRISYWPMRPCSNQRGSRSRLSVIEGGFPFSHDGGVPRSRRRNSADGSGPDPTPATVIFTVCAGLMLSRSSRSWQLPHDSTCVSTDSRSGPLSCSVSNRSRSSAAGHGPRSRDMRGLLDVRSESRHRDLVGGSASVQSVRYYYLTNTFPLLGRRQVQDEPVALTFRHIE